MTAPTRTGASACCRAWSSAGSAGSSTSPRWRAWSPASAGDDALRRRRRATWSRLSQSLHLENLQTRASTSARLCPGFTYSGVPRRQRHARPGQPRRRRPGCGWGPTRWPRPATRRWRPTARSARARRAQQGDRRRRQAAARRVGPGADGLAGHRGSARCADCDRRLTGGQTWLVRFIDRPPDRGSPPIAASPGRRSTGASTMSPIRA